MLRLNEITQTYFRVQVVDLINKMICVISQCGCDINLHLKTCRNVISCLASVLGAVAELYRFHCFGGSGSVVAPVFCEKIFLGKLSSVSGYCCNKLNHWWTLSRRLCLIWGWKPEMRHHEAVSQERIGCFSSTSHFQRLMVNAHCDVNENSSFVTYFPKGINI